MNRFAMLVILVVVLVATVSPLVAQEEPPTLARAYTLEVKEGHDADFEAAIKKQVEWYQQNNETWRWDLWQYETGDDFGKFVFRSPNHYWKDMDDRSERGAKARANFMGTVMPHVETMSAGITEVMTKLSRWPEDLGDVPMVTVYEFKVEYGMSEQFVHALAKINEAIDEAEWPVEFAWMTRVSGGEVPAFLLIVPHMSWADMEGPGDSVWAVMEKTMGRADAQMVRTAMQECVSELHVSLVRYRPDLSYIPPTE